MRPIDISCNIININRPQIPAKPENCHRIVLFSDIHLGHFPINPIKLLNKRILGAFNHLLFRRCKLHRENIIKLSQLLPEIAPNTVVCAGDLTSVSLDNEFDDALSMLTPFIGNDFLYVPGNHDIYISGAHCHQKLTEVFSKANNHRLDLSALPCVIMRDGIAFLLLNAAKPVAYHLSCGIIDDEIQEKADAALASVPQQMPCIAVCHFPALNANGKSPDWRHGLRHSEYLSDKLASGRLAAILSGHVHHPYSFFSENGGLQACSGSLTMHDSFIICDIIKNCK